MFSFLKYTTVALKIVYFAITLNPRARRYKFCGDSISSQSEEQQTAPEYSTPILDVLKPPDVEGSQHESSINENKCFMFKKVKQDLGLAACDFLCRTQNY